MTDQALSHLTVLDLTQYIAGSYCTALLAGLGAEVIKIEKPGSGDGARNMPPFLGDDRHPDKSALFLYLNSCKKSITLNLKTAAGAGVFRQLVATADAVVESFEPRVMPSLGLDFENLITIKPDLVMTSISNFGQTGPYRDYKATEIVMQALGGLMYITNSWDQTPVVFGLTQAEYLAGMAGAAGTMTALFSSDGGNGVHVDVSLMECVATAIQWQLAQYGYTGAVTRGEPKSGEMGGFSVFPARDGYVLPLFYGYSEWGDVAVLLDEPELADGRFATREDRLRHSVELNDLLRRALSKRNKREVAEMASDLGFAWGVVQNAEDVARCPQLKARGFFVDIDHPVAGTLTYPGAPFKMSETAWQSQPAPRLGEHNEAIYRERLGYSKRDLADLWAAGVI